MREKLLKILRDDSNPHDSVSLSVMDLNQQVPSGVFQNDEFGIVFNKDDNNNVDDRYLVLFLI